MGYYTIYSLTAEKIAGRKPVKVVTLDDVEVMVRGGVGREDVLAALSVLKAGGVPVEETDSDMIEGLRDSCESASYALSEDGESRESCKWYDHEDDLRRWSAAHPDWLFTLSGTGEEGDKWMKYFVGGKCQVAEGRVIYDTFDPKLLA